MIGARGGGSRSHRDVTFLHNILLRASRVSLCTLAVRVPGVVCVCVPKTAPHMNRRLRNAGA